MLKLLADENLNAAIIKGVLRRNPSLDVVRVQEHGLRGAEDADILEWAAARERIVVTHDVSTMTAHAMRRVERGLAMPGIIEVGIHVPIARAIDDLLLLAECSLHGEWEGQVLYLPL